MIARVIFQIFFPFSICQMFYKVSTLFSWQNLLLERWRKEGWWLRNWGNVSKSVYPEGGENISATEIVSKNSQCLAGFWKLPRITFPKENMQLACILLNWLLEKDNTRNIWWHFSYRKWHGHMASRGVGELILWSFQNSRRPFQIHTVGRGQSLYLVTVVRKGLNGHWENGALWNILTHQGNVDVGEPRGGREDQSRQSSGSQACWTQLNQRGF